ncbi:MAG: 1-deoxy-D-xylulose-5-phosphate synthase [Chlamydiota bacterium]
MTPLLDKINCPQDLNLLSTQELIELAAEIRSRIIEVLSITGGHLASNLGIVELTIALHATFSSPKDKILFDVGHQAYVHKLLTGRNARFPTLRQTNGLSGFTDPTESIHDHFYSGHAGNTLSLALGLAKNRDLMNNQHHILPVLGDASLTCGLTLEAMNNIPKQVKNFTIILNDNAMSISKNVGAITTILSRFFNSSTASHIYQELTKLATKIPGYGETLAKQGTKIKESLKNLMSTAPFFEQFGLNYIGPINGHDIEKLMETFAALKTSHHPTLVHVLTVKGQGMKQALDQPIPYHGAKPFDRSTGKFHQSKTTLPTFPKVFGSHMLKLAETDPNITAITPAMPVGSCLDALMQRYPNRCIDVGIAEGHAITYAAGMAKEGNLKVVACVYSTFLQRAFDNIYHDVCVQQAPLVLAIDRAGLATGDGVTAQGIYDISFLNAMPNLAIVQPRDGDQLKALLQSAINWNCPTAIRYPNLVTTETANKPIPNYPFGQGEVLADGEDIALIALGHMCFIALEAREKLLEYGISALVIDPVFVKPLDRDLILNTCEHVKLIATIEEHALQGGLGSVIAHFLASTPKVKTPTLHFGLPDRLIPHGKHADLIEKFNLTATAISATIQQTLAQSQLLNPLKGVSL